LKAHRNNDGKTDRDQESGKVDRRNRMRERERKEKGGEGEKLSSAGGLLAIEKTEGTCGGGREG